MGSDELGRLLPFPSRRTTPDQPLTDWQVEQEIRTELYGERRKVVTLVPRTDRRRGPDPDAHGSAA